MVHAEAVLLSTCGNCRSVICGLTALISRRFWAKFIAFLFGVSMASHVMARVVSMPAHHLRLIALCRLLVSFAVLVVFLYLGRDKLHSESP